MEKDTFIPVRLRSMGWIELVTARIGVSDFLALQSAEGSMHFIKGVSG